MTQNVQPLNFDNLLDGLEALRAAQEPLLEHLGHNNIDPDTLARYGNALSIEVAEFVNETPWKIWKPGQVVSRDKLIDEFADILAYIGVWTNLLECFGITAGDLAAGYATKRMKNVARLAGESKELGYDGVPPVGVLHSSDV